MRMKFWMGTILLASGWVAQAATVGEVGTRESLVEATLREGRRESLFHAGMLDRWSVGAAYLYMDRRVTLESAEEQRLRAHLFGLELGMDLFPWLTLYGSAGGGNVRAGDAVDFADAGPRWAAGLHLNWWHVYVTDPVFLAGRLSFQSSAEFARVDVPDAVHWNEGYADLTVHYEMYIQNEESLDACPYSFVWYAGGAVSRVEGESAGRGFSQGALLGVIGGVEYYLAHNLSVGVQAQYFEAASFGGSLRYHF